jgi:hypothetical protein
MIGRPRETEAAKHFLSYIDQVPGDDPLAVIESQLAESMALFATIDEEKSKHRYEDGKWSVRELINHITDTERAFAFRALWFSRGFTTPLPGYDQNIAAAGAGADSVAWVAHVEEFRTVRESTIALFRNMPAEGWSRSGVASDNLVSVRALAFIIVGHVTHHVKILRERYL